jgi:methylmalonyl-CoA/ethylmalonyl-CoA epimerase
MHVVTAAVNEPAPGPARQPVFTETMQIGIVVRDLDATLRRYIEDFGIGPWEIFEVSPEIAPDLRENGQPIRGSTRAATTPNYDDVIAEQTQRGVTLPLDGSFGGIKVAYLPTDRDLGVILEVFSGFGSADEESDANENT